MGGPSFRRPSFSNDAAMGTPHPDRAIAVRLSWDDRIALAANHHEAASAECGGHALCTGGTRTLGSGDLPECPLKSLAMWMCESDRSAFPAE